MVTDKKLMQAFCAHYDMEDSYIGCEFRLVSHSLSAAAVNSVGGYHSRTREGVFTPLHFGINIKSMAMSHQCGTPRRAHSGCAKPQRSSSIHVPKDYEPHISGHVRVLVEAWENKVLNRKLSTREDGSCINHY